MSLDKSQEGGGGSCGFSSCRDVSPQSPPSSGGRKSGETKAGLGWGGPTYWGSKPWTCGNLRQSVRAAGSPLTAAPPS